jgi:glycosyl transferase family 25
MRAYVINLKRSTERRATMIAQLTKSGLDHEIVEAVDGRDLDFSDPGTDALVDSSARVGDLLLPNEIACVLSHLRVYERIVADELDQALVFEDDVLLTDNLLALVDAIAEHLVGAEVALLHFDSLDVCRMSLEGRESLPTARQLVSPIDVYQPTSAGAYIITREACERIIKQLLPVCAKADEWGYRFTAGMIDRVRCVAPMAAKKNPVFESTMEYYSPVSLKGRIVTMVTRYNIGFLRKIIAYRRQLIWRKYNHVHFTDDPFVNKPSRLN